MHQWLSIESYWKFKSPLHCYWEFFLRFMIQRHFFGQFFVAEKSPVLKCVSIFSVLCLLVPLLLLAFISCPAVLLYEEHNQDLYISSCLRVRIRFLLLRLWLRLFYWQQNLLMKYFEKNFYNRWHNTPNAEPPKGTSIFLTFSLFKSLWAGNSCHFPRHYNSWVPVQAIN
jgi:hypothetical protein